MRHHRNCREETCRPSFVLLCRKLWRLCDNGFKSSDTINRQHIPAIRRYCSGHALGRHIWSDLFRRRCRNMGFDHRNAVKPNRSTEHPKRQTADDHDRNDGAISARRSVAGDVSGDRSIIRVWAHRCSNGTVRRLYGLTGWRRTLARQSGNEWVHPIIDDRWNALVGSRCILPPPRHSRFRNRARLFVGRAIRHGAVL